MIRSLAEFVYQFIRGVTASKKGILVNNGYLLQRESWVTSVGAGIAHRERIKFKD